MYERYPSRAKYYFESPFIHSQTSFLYEQKAGSSPKYCNSSGDGALTSSLNLYAGLSLGILLFVYMGCFLTDNKILYLVIEVRRNDRYQKKVLTDILFISSSLKSILMYCLYHDLRPAVLSKHLVH